MCRAHATVRGLVRHLIANGSGPDIVLDMEAGLEHLSRGTDRHVDVMLAVIEPYFRSLETGRRVAELATELEIGRVWVVANKVRDDEDRDAIREYCADHGLQILSEIPYDRTLVDAERAGQAPIDFDPACPAVAEVRTLAGRLVETADVRGSR